MTTPVPVYHFSVDWSGTRMGFTRVKGLEARTDPIEYREGSFASDDVVSIPGLKLNDNVVLSRGVIPSDNDFFDWYATVRSGTAERRDVTISLLDGEHTPVMVWKLKNAWPVSVEGPVLDAMQSEIAIESLEIAHEGIAIEAGR